MNTDVGTAPKLPSGVDLIDETWGGLYEGGSYLVFGRSESGRGFIPLLFAAKGDASAPSLYLSSQPTRNVIERARQAGIHLNEPPAIRIERLPLHTDSPATNDDGRAAHLEALAATVERVGPTRVVIDDFMPFVQFQSFDRFQVAFTDMLNRLDAADATLVLTIAEPANEESDEVIRFMHRQMTGALHIEKGDETGDALSSDLSSTLSSTFSSLVRRVTFLPNIGHAGCEGEREWNVRRWVAASTPIPLSTRSSRTRHTRAAHPSPRTALWDESTDHGNGPTVPAIRLGRSDQRTPPSTSAFSTEPRRTKSDVSRIPRIPLGGAGTHSARAVWNEPRAEADNAAEIRGWTNTRGSGEIGPEKEIEPEKLRARTAGPEAVARHPADEHARARNVGDGDVAGVVDERTSHTDREAFRARLQQQYLRNEIDEAPFVLVAIRMDRPDEAPVRPFDFDFILDLASESMRDQDDMLVDLDAERLVILLSDSEAGAAQRFFAHLKRRVLDEAPQQADYLMRSVAAIVVPDGEPFRTAEAFLSYVMDESD